MVLFALIPQPQRDPYAIAAAALSFLCTLPIFALSAVEHVKSTRPSTLLSTYLLISVFFDVARLRSIWLYSVDWKVAVALSASFSVQLLVLLLEAVEKRNFLNAECQDKSREELAGIYNRSMYWWLNHLFRTGYRSALVPENLDSLDDGLNVRILEQKFRETWTKSTATSTSAIGEGATKYRWPLVQTVARVMLPSLLWPIAAKMAVVTFTLCQPVALNRLLLFLQGSENINVGYGLLGAYALIYVGIAVSTEHSQTRRS